MRNRFLARARPLIGGPVTQTVDFERAGTMLKWDASGSLADRAIYDARPKGYTYYSVDPLPHRVFVKLSDTSGDWSPGQVLSGSIEGNGGFTPEQLVLPGNPVGDALDLRAFGKSAGLVGTRTEAQSVEFPASVLTVTTQGYASVGDAGGATYRRAMAEPTHAGKFRSLDRNRSDGTANTVNGGWWEIANPVLTPEQFGAKGDGVTGDAAAIIAASVCANAQGNKVINFRSVTYLIDAHMRFLNYAPRWIGTGQTRFSSAGFDVYVVKPEVTMSNAIVTNKYITNQGNLLASNAAAGSTTITLTAGKGANITAGQWVVMRSQAYGPGTIDANPLIGHLATLAEFVFVESKAGDVLTLASPTEFSYLTADTAEVLNAPMISGAVFEGINIDAPYETYTVGLYLTGCLAPRVRNVSTTNFRGPSVQFESCVLHRADKISGENGLSSNVTALTGFSYLVCELGLNGFGRFTDLVGVRLRHTYTTAETSDKIGQPMFSVIDGLDHYFGRGSGFDTHPAGYRIDGYNCHTHGCLAFGHGIRSYATRLINSTASSCIGSGINVEGGAQYAEIVNYTGYNNATGTVSATNAIERGDIWDCGLETRIDGVVSTDSGGPALQRGNSAGNLSAKAEWSNIRVRNAGRKSPTASYAVGISVALTSGTLKVRRVFIEQPSQSLSIGLRQSNGNVRMDAQDIEVTGLLTTPISTLVTDKVRGGPGTQSNARGPEITVTLTTATNATIDTQAVGSDNILVKPFNNAATTMSQLLGGRPNDEVELAFDTTLVTLIHSNNLFIRNAANYVSTAQRRTRLIFRCIGSGVWAEISGR